MKLHLLIGTAVLLSAASHLVNAEDGHGGRPPAAGEGTAQTGGTGSKSMNEGVQPGAPGNIVTAAEGTVMSGHDIDADGFVSKSEAAKNGDLAKQFAKLDANRDGKLDGREFGTFTPSESAATGAAPVNSKDASSRKN